jgi:hypothetical protein
MADQGHNRPLRLGEICDVAHMCRRHSVFCSVRRNGATMLNQWQSIAVGRVVDGLIYTSIGAGRSCPSAAACLIWAILPPGTRAIPAPRGVCVPYAACRHHRPLPARPFLPVILPGAAATLRAPRHSSAVPPGAEQHAGVTRSKSAPRDPRAAPRALPGRLIR